MFHFNPFFSIWFWLLAATVWSMATHFTHGVPYDVMRRAARHGGEDAEICDRLARRRLTGIAAGVRRWGAAGAAAAGFALGGLAVAGFGAGYGAAQGLFALAAPVAAMLLLSLREAVRLAEAPPEPPVLLARLFRRRLANQFVGILGAGLAAAALATVNADRIAFFRSF